MQVNIVRVVVSSVVGAALVLFLLCVALALTGCLDSEPATKPAPIPANYWHERSFEDSFYFHDNRVDLCYMASTIAGSTNFVLVPCTDKVMGVAIEVLP